MEEIIKVAVISDLHCSHSSVSGAITSTRLITDSLREPINEHPVESLLKLIRTSELEVDFLFCPGDLSDKIDIQGVISGFDFVNEIRNQFNNCPLFISTGNHDVDSRRHHKAFSSANYVTKYFSTEYPSKDILKKQTYWSDGYYIYEDDNILVLNLNTTHESLNEEDAKVIQIPTPTLQRIEDQLKNHNIGKVFIAHFHHHPIKMSNSKLIYKDHDVIENGDKLLALLSRNKCDLVIHGHKHIPLLTNHNKLPIFSSGSFSSLQNVAEHGGYNTFHILTIIKNNVKTKIKIETWVNTLTRGWKFSKEPYEWFPPNTGFGSTLSVEEVKRTITDLIGNKEKINFDEIIDEIPDIQFLTPMEQEDLESSLKKLSLEFVPKLPLIPRYLTNYRINE